MKSIAQKFIVQFCAIFFSLTGFAQLAVISGSDSICGHTIVRDNENRILGWYKPEIPGAGYDNVVRLASGFVKQTPVEQQTGLPMYLVTCCFQGPHMTKEKDFVAEHWMHNPACVFAGMVQSLAIQYRVYSGDSSFLPLIKNMLDYQLKNGTTPLDFKWANVPYASADPLSTIYQGATRWEQEGMRGDGLHGIEPDKVGELGYAYLRFYQITMDTVYLNAAIDCADALALHVRDVRPEASPFTEISTKKSPWPFRVNARNGIVIDEYCSNVIEPIKLFDELIRTENKIQLSEIQLKSYKKARSIAWGWLYSKNGPLTTFIWNGYFEDIPNDPDRSNRNQVSPIEFAKFLIEHPQFDVNLHVNVPSLIYWVANAFKTENLDAIKEQTWCFEPMASHTARYGSACAMYYQITGNKWYKDQAYRFLNVATYMTYDNGVVAVGPNWPGSWFSDGYGDYIRHFIDAMAAVPEWAPDGNHLLKSTSIIQKINYEANKISFTTFDDQSEVVLRLASKPKTVTVSGKVLKQINQLDGDGYVWKALDKGGVLKMKYTYGSEVVLKL